MVNVHECIFPLGTPLDEPECLFDDSACDKTTEIVIGVGVIALFVLVILAVRLTRQRRYRELRAMSWRVNVDEFLISANNAKIDKNKSTSELRMMSRKSLFSEKDNTETLRVPFKDIDMVSDKGEYLDEDAPSMLRQSELSFV